MATERKMFVLGLDCLAPQLIFDRWKEALPHFAALTEGGLHGPMRSCDPPITVPAWSVMTTGADPGELGVYGFHNRASYNYFDLFVANGRHIRRPRVWDILSGAGRQSIVIGVPQTFPVQPLRGYLVAGLLAGDSDHFTWPARLKNSLRQYAPDYRTDIGNFRHLAPEKLLRELYRMTDARFKWAERMMTHYPWDFFMLVEIGPDRLHHAFWHFMDEQSPYHKPGSPYRQAIRNYYLFLDEWLGRLVARLDAGTDIMVVSDHGAQTMKGLMRVNQWLINEGYLVLKSQPRDSRRLEVAMVDWDKTRVWADGGYYARLYFNVRGREPSGIVPAASVQELKTELRQKLSRIHLAGGKTVRGRIIDPRETYRALRGIPPDLMLYVDELAYRASASVGGTENVFTLDNDTGPDGANHDFDGVFILRGEGVAPRRLDGCDIHDVAPTILSRMGQAVTEGMKGRVLES